MNNEDTIFDNENNKFDKGETQLDNNVKQKTEKNKTNSKKTTNNSRVVDNNGIEEDNTVEDNKKRSFLKNAAAGFGMGVLMGATAAYASDDVDLAGADLESMVGEELIEESIEEPTEGLSLSDGEISVASSVSNEMSFSEAFAAAREEVGPGGVFEWNGNVYNTYYAEEWENMSDEEREEFASHLNVEEPSDSDEELLVEAEDDEIEIIDEETTDSDEELLVEAEDEEIEIIDEETTDSEEELLAEAEDEEISVAEDVDIVEQEEAGVEVLGIYEDAETGANIGVIDVDGLESMLIDVDGDSNFDYIAADIDGDGVISEYEVGDISEENMTVDMLEVYDEVYDDDDDESMAFDDFDDNVDYINDADVSDYMA